ncbi:hypothetical protein ONZ45_g17189 [Pleurotus djamor]|nr:hypothetical protein ONZ45_g17189 [Pleurotus djamor]
MNHICLPHLRLLDLKCHPLRIQLLDHISAPHIEQVHIHAEHPAIPEFDLAPLYSFVGLRPTSCYTTESATLEFGDDYEVRISLEITHHIPSLSNLHSSLVFMSYSEDHMDVERVCESIPFRGLHLLDIKQDFSPDEDGCITSTTCYPPDIWIRPFQHFPTIAKICMETYDAVDTLTTVLELDTSLFPAIRCLEIKDVDFSSEVCHFLNFTEYLRKRMEKGNRLQELILHTMDKPVDKLQWAMLSRLVGGLFYK